ncbi:MAG: glycosyltransferase [Nocardiaceae bacterium]|nr:glycosyltransferase [Nocardiaceae bacterium]
MHIGPVFAVADTNTLWSGATWIGKLSIADIGHDSVTLKDSDGYSRARLLVWDNGRPRGFAEVPVRNGKASGDDIRRAVALLPLPAAPPYAGDGAVSVVICTKDRPDQLRVALSSLVSLAYPNMEIVVVDNNPSSGLTKPVVAEFTEHQIRFVQASTPGLSVARNAGALAATSPIVAFTDDDVIVDPDWLRSIVGAFSRDSRIACVTGMVPSAELTSAAQDCFDRRVGWSKHCSPEIYDLADPPAENKLFPFEVARFGTGANFAARRSHLIELGGFDEGLGVGSPAGGGEDIDFFVRVLLAGYKLCYEPAAVVWHLHRRDASGLRSQLQDYGLGLGAWIAKLLLTRATLFMVLRRLAPGVRHWLTVSELDAGQESDLTELNRVERKALARGPWRLFRSRLQGRRARPLKGKAL